MALVPVPKKWDYEADVIVVGAGNAGLPAATVAAEAGAKVAILELMSYCASSLGIITGGVGFVDLDAEKEQGTTGTVEQYYKERLDLSKGDLEFWKVFADNQFEVYKWCKEIGMNLVPNPARIGGRGFRAEGAGMLKCLEKAARGAGAEILFLHRATRLITDPKTGRVLGLKVTVKDKTQNFKAKRAVILTTGGFGRNKDMVREYGPEFVDCIPYMPPGHLGDGLKMGLDIGAGTKHLGGAVISSDSVDAETKEWNSSHVTGSIFVNVHGKTYTNEADPTRFYGLICRDGMRQPGGLFWRVYDEKMKNLPTMIVAKPKKRKPVQADTIEELAKKAGIDPKGLKETIDKYNSDIDSVGYDTVFGRKPMREGESLIKIDTPPFYAFRCAPTISSFKGGLKVNTSFQVVSNYDEVIPGLYAAGEVHGGLWGANGTYFGGTMVPAAMVFGRIAGKNAAAEKPW